MRAKEFLSEKALDPGALFDPRHLSWRPQNFLKKLEDGTPFVDKQGNEYFPEKGEAARLAPIVNKTLKDLKKNPMTPLPQIQINIKGQGMMPVRKFEKADLQTPAGQFTTAVNVQPIGIGIASLPRATIKGKSKEAVTTDQAIQDALDKHSEIPAGKLYDVIRTNPTLDGAGLLGVAIKKAAQEINEGINPSVSAYDEKTQKTIAIDAGEYLGILAMIKDVAEFPKKEGFLKFLKAPDLSKLLLIFPGEQNASLADSYGIQNVKTGATIMISSKGGVGRTATGAAPALKGLNASIEKRKSKIKPGNGLDFISTMNATSTAKQGFVGWNWVNDNYPDRVPNYLKKLLPFNDEDMDKVLQNVKMKGTTPFPSKYKKFITAPYMKPSKGTAGGSFIYFLTRELVKLVNEGLIPNFRETVLSLLDENFMQIFTRVVGGKLTFKVLWPGKVDGDVTLYSKLSTADLSQALSFKITD